MLGKNETWLGLVNTSLSSSNVIARSCLPCQNASYQTRLSQTFTLFLAEQSSLSISQRRWKWCSHGYVHLAISPSPLMMGTNQLLEPFQSTFKQVHLSTKADLHSRWQERKERNFVMWLFLRLPIWRCSCRISTVSSQWSVAVASSEIDDTRSLHSYTYENPKENSYLLSMSVTRFHWMFHHSASNDPPLTFSW